MLNRLRCLIRDQHEPARHPLGGFRCVQCGAPGADLSEMGFPGGGYVNPLRRVFSRDKGGEFTRTAAWEPRRSGGY